MSFSENLIRIRKERNLTKAELAKRLNMPYTTYNNFENGREPKDDVKMKIAEAIGCSLFELMGDEMVELAKKGMLSWDNEPSMYQQQNVMLEKFNQLDVYGKRLVETVIKLEYERVMNNK